MHGEAETRPAHASQLCWAASQARRAKGEAEGDCRGPAKNGWEAFVTGYPFTLQLRNFFAPLSLQTLRIPTGLEPNIDVSRKIRGALKVQKKRSSMRKRRGGSP